MFSISFKYSSPLPQNGTLKIIDRKKHIFKLAQGEYISPEKIENIYIRSEPVAQLYVHGDSLQVNVCIRTRLLLFIGNKSSHKCTVFELFFPPVFCLCSPQSCLVGIVVPDPEVMPEWAKKKGILGTYKDLCKNTVRDTSDLSYR